MSVISHKGPTTDMIAAVVKNAHRGLKPTVEIVFSFWHSACDALLSDPDTMAKLKACTYLAGNPLLGLSGNAFLGLFGSTIFMHQRCVCRPDNMTSWSASRSIYAPRS